jgi:hypothetical protein
MDCGTAITVIFKMDCGTAITVIFKMDCGTAITIFQNRLWDCINYFFKMDGGTAINISKWTISKGSEGLHCFKAPCLTTNLLTKGIHIDNPGEYT